MAIQHSCPACGSPVLIRNPGLISAVCEACDTVLYRENDALIIGEISALGEPPTALAVGKEGQVGDLRGTLIGRVVYENPDFQWTEWVFETAEKTYWLTEDAKQFLLCQAVNAPIPPQLSLNDYLVFNERRFRVDEVGEAVCKGVQGQLPRHVVPGESLRYADLSEVDGRDKLLVEWRSDQNEALLGLAFSADQVDFGEADSQGEVVEAKALRCPNCAAPTPLPKQGEAAQTLICEACDSVLDLSEAEAVVVGRNLYPADFSLNIGAVGTLDGEPHEVIGRISFAEEDGERYNEYLVWSEKLGYAWLEEADYSWILTRPINEGPAYSELNDVRHIRDLKGKHFIFDERGTVTIAYVDGALPWRARLGDQSRYISYRAGRFCYTVEESDRENERSFGYAILASTLFKAFGVEGKSSGSSFGGVEDFEDFSLDHSRLVFVAVAILFIVFFLFCFIGTVSPTPRYGSYGHGSSFGSSRYSGGSYSGGK